MIDGMNRAVPIGSNRLKICPHVWVWRSEEEVPSELGRQKRTTKKAIAPMGRLTRTQVSRWQTLTSSPSFSHCRNTISKIHWS